MNRSNMLRNITEKAGLQAEALPGVSLLELSGDDRILVENHRCVVGYTDSEVLIRVSFGLIQITGQGLLLSCAKKEQLIIHGNIACITLIK